jgi:DNA-binding transcriptional MerR regulator
MTDGELLVYFTTTDVAERAGLSPAGVLDNVRKRRLSPVARTSRGVRLFDQRDVEQWLADRARRRGVAL